MIVIIIKSIIIKSTLAIPSAEKIKSDKKIVCVVKTAYGPGTFLIIKQECKCGQRHNQHFLFMGLLSHDNKLHTISTQMDHFHL